MREGRSVHGEGGGVTGATLYLTVQEVADRMRCEHRTVRRAIRSGEVQAARIGGRWLIPEDAVDAWFEA
jgi:excisionase family DNA binding protein